MFNARGKIKRIHINSNIQTLGFQFLHFHKYEHLRTRGLHGYIRTFGYQRASCLDHEHACDNSMIRMLICYRPIIINGWTYLNTHETRECVVSEDWFVDLDLQPTNHLLGISPYYSYYVLMWLRIYRFTMKFFFLYFHLIII